MSNLRGTLVNVTFRDYTTDGRFLDTRTFTTTTKMLGEDVGDLLSPEGTYGAKEMYMAWEYMKDSETVKDVFRTNVMVRDFNTNKLIKWAHLV